MPLASLNPRIESFQPTGQKILVRRHPGEKEIGGIIMPDNQTKIGLAKGAVLAVGAKVEHIRKGDVALFPVQFGYNRVDLNGEHCEIVPVDSVFAVEESP